MSTNVNKRYIGGSSNVNVDNKSFHTLRSELTNEIINCLLTMILIIFIGKMVYFVISKAVEHQLFHLRLTFRLEKPKH